MRDLDFELRRPAVLAYAAGALVLSATLLSLSLRRGTGEFSAWLAAYLLVGLVSVRAPAGAPLVAGAMAFLCGFVRTYRSGFNLDLGLSLVALSVGLYLLGRVTRGERSLRVDLGGLSLFAIAAWSLVSLAFVVVRVRCFAPAPGFAYHTYQFNASGFASDEAVIRAIIGATATFTWFGLYEYARSVRLPRRTLNVAVFVALLLNTEVLLVQRYVDPGFLHPAGWPPYGRLNGLTSFCYALGDVVLALYLLLPAWGVARGLLGLLTAGSVGLLTYAAVASGSRTALFTMLLASVAWACVRVFRLSRSRRRRAALVVLAAASLLLALTFVAYRLTPATQESPLGRLKHGIERQGLLGHLVTQRLASYPLLFRVMGAYPLSGVGAGLYLAEASKQRALLMPALALEEPYLLTSFAPNQFLNTGVELGVPAMTALVVVFACAAFALLRRRVGAQPEPEQAGDLLVSLLALAAALQLGPSFYNSEALVFLWLVVGLAARGGAAPDTSGEAKLEAQVRAGGFGSRATAAIVAGAVVLGIAGHLLSLPALAVEHQWQRLRWRLGIGMLEQQTEGRWSRPEATFSVDTAAATVAIRWHAGDTAAPDYRTEVSFYVDGALVERSPARSGPIRESVLPLPRVPGLKRISVRVAPPFVPSAASGGQDQRRLGIFIHSVKPAE